MADAIPEFRPSPDARELADALRSGLAVRRSRLDADAYGAEEARLRELGDLEGLPPVAKPGPAAPFVKFVRKILQVFLRPWLAVQTIFNRELARRFQNTITSVRDLERRAPHIEKSLEQLTARIRQLEERHDVPDGSRPHVPGDTIDSESLERMFLHSRMPRPPARVLNLGNAGITAATELASFGFDVWSVDARPIDFTHPRIRRCRSIAGALPFADATFDVVVSLSAAADVTLLDESANAAVVREVSRVIKPGGHFIMTIEGRGPAANPVALASTLAPLRVTETLRASRALNVWSVDTPVIPGGDDAQQGTSRMLVVAERAP